MELEELFIYTNKHKMVDIFYFGLNHRSKKEIVKDKWRINCQSIRYQGLQNTNSKDFSSSLQKF